MEGKFIALEGPDGCGKSTQAELFKDWLESKGREVIVTKEPTDNPLGKVLRRSLRGEINIPVEAEALLFAGDRAVHVSEVIKPALEEGKIVITERYLYSSLAYQTSRGLSQEWVENINEPAIDPDLGIVIDVDPKVGSERMNSSRELDIFDEDIELQEKVREAYKRLAEEKNLALISGEPSEDVVHEEIKNKVEKIVTY